MKYAVIAAGEGSRLKHEGIDIPKPLITIGGEPLIRRLIRIFMNNGAEEIIVICRDDMPQVSTYLQKMARERIGSRPIPLRTVVRRTAGSMHSLGELRPWLDRAECCVTTVDTLFDENEFARYIRSFNQDGQNAIDALMGVTDHIDDEKPLYVATENGMRITGFFDTHNRSCTYISGGIYALQPCVWATLERCIGRGEHRMRSFQRALIAEGRNVYAHNFGKIFDIDHPTDIMKAESFLAGVQPKTIP